MTCNWISGSVSNDTLWVALNVKPWSLGLTHTCRNVRKNHKLPHSAVNYCVVLEKCAVPGQLRQARNQGGHLHANTMNCYRRWTADYWLLMNIYDNGCQDRLSINTGPLANGQWTLLVTSDFLSYWPGLPSGISTIAKNFKKRKTKLFSWKNLQKSQEKGHVALYWTNHRPKFTMKSHFDETSYLCLSI